MLIGAFLFGGARLPNGLTIAPEQLMICLREVLLRLETRRAVIERLATARRVFGRIDIIPKKDATRSGQIVRPFGSLAPPKDTPTRF